MTEPVIRTEEVEKSFPGAGPVVDHVSVTLERGEFVALLGPSGCGKSTFLRIIAGLDLPSSGNVYTSGTLGFVFQEAHLIPWRSVEKNVALPLELLGVNRTEALQTARRELKRVGLSDALKRYPSQLSGGMKMRTSVARALVSSPSLLLLDEPFSALDEPARHALQDELRGIWASQGLTVVFVTHSVSEAAYLSQRIIAFSRKPARVILDRPSGLPPERGASLRTSSAFAKELASVYAAIPDEGADL